MTQLKDKNGNNVMPNTTAENVSYGNSTVAAALAGGGGGGGGGSYAPLAGKKICFFGDSITDQLATTGGYAQLVCKKLGSYYGIGSGDLNPYQYGTQGGQRNVYGISGVDAAAVRGMVLADIENGRQAITGDFYRGIYAKYLSPNTDFEDYKDYTQYDAVVIMIGTNGGVTGDVNANIPDICIYDVLPTLEGGHDYSYSDDTKTIREATLEEPMDFFDKCFPGTFYGNIAASIEYIRWKNPNCRIYLITIPPNLYTTAAESTGVRQALINLAAKMGVQVIDAQAHAGLGKWDIKYWSDDNLHPNAFGKELWASYIANELSKQWYSSNVTTT